MKAEKSAKKSSLFKNTRKKMIAGIKKYKEYHEEIPGA